MRPHSLAALVLLFLAALTTAASERVSIGDPIFTTVGDGESIPGLIVSAVAQDRAGFLWLGTHEGVIRYDGYQFRRYRHDPRDEHSLSDNVIRAIEPGDDGRIWIATNNGGVSIFDPATGAFQRLVSGDGPTSLTSNDARAFARGDGGMWVGTRSALHFVEYGTLHVRKVSAAPPASKAGRRDSIGSLLADRNGDLWIGSASGLAIRHRNGAIEIVSGETRDWLHGKPINGLFQARDGAIWISVFAGGLARLTSASGELRVLSDRRSYSVAQPSDAEVWIGTSGEGLEVRDAASGALLRVLQHDAAVPETIDGDRVGSLFVDRAGVLWIGLWGRGLNRHLPAGAFRMIAHSPTRPDLLTHPDVGCIFEARDGTLWIGTRGNGVDVLDPQRGLLFGLRAGDAPNALGDADVPAIAQTADGIMWIGTTNGLHRYDVSAKTMKRYVIAPVNQQPMGGVATLAPSAEGGLWVGATGGLAYFDPQRETFDAVLYEDGSPVDAQISSIVTDRRGALWVATQTGLAVRLPNATRFRKFTRELRTGSTLSSNAVIGLLVDRRGTVWVGTATGLDRLTSFDDERATFEAIAPRIGREGERGENLVEDPSGWIWIDGETMFDPQTLQSRTFAPAEGAGRVIWRGAAARLASGQLMFGGPDGLLVADSRAIGRWTYEPPVAISTLRVDDVPRSVDAGALSLEPRNRSFSVEFASLDLSSPERNRYSYRLRGFDDKWIDTDASRRVAAYTAIPPGSYVLEIRGSNRAGLWSSNVLRLPVVVHPAFHQTTLFRIALGALVLALIYAAYRGRVRYLEARREELEEVVRVRTAELDRAARTDFLTALSNRRDLLERAEVAQRSGEPYSVVLADVDNFKKLNDELGHDAGDSALKHVAQFLTEHTRRNDIAARWGGEEFLLFLPATDGATAELVAERARQALQGSSWMWEGRTRFVTMAFGVATAKGGESIDDVIRRADSALLTAKREGKNRVVRALATALLMLLCSTSMFALDPARRVTQYQRDVLQREHGLPQNSVQSIVQTRDGYVWFGTEQGPARYNGSKVVSFDAWSAPGASGYDTQVLFEDRSGTLWMGSHGHGLAQWRDGRVVPVPARLSNSYVFSIAQDANGGMWIGTDASLEHLAGNRVETFTSKQGLGEGTVYAVAARRDGSVWAGTKNGLTEIRNGVLRTYTTRDGLPTNSIRSLYEDRSGTLWIGTVDAGLVRLQNGAFTVVDGIPNPVVFDILEDRDGNVWIATGGGGLARWRDGRVAVLASDAGLTNDTVLSLMEDREGTLWAGTDGGGITRLKDSKFVTVTKADGLSSDVVLSVHEDANGYVWMGTLGAGVNRLSGDSIRHYTTRDGLSNDQVFSVSGDRSGAIWIGTNDGLNRLQNDRFTIYRPKNGLASTAVSAIYEDRAGNMWFGTPEGVSRFRDGRFTTLRHSDGLPANFVLAILEDRSGNMWFGTDGGLSRFGGKSFTNFGTKNGLADALVMALHEDDDGVLWIATRKGLTRFTDGKFTSYRRHDGLFDDLVLAVLDDHRGSLWVSSNNGVFRLSKQQLADFAAGRVKRIESIAFGTADGLGSAECNGGVQPSAMRSRNNTFWFPTIKGAAFIDPARIRTNAIRPATVIEQIVADERVIAADKPLRLAAGTHRVEIHFAGLSFTSPDRVRFRYRLEGFDDDWIDGGTRRSAIYTNLAPGNYRFTVMAANNDGLWSASPAALEIEQIPFFRQTVGFVVLWIAIAAALCFLFVYSWMRRLRAEYAGKLAERARIALELHDTVAQDLVGVRLLLDQAAAASTSDVAAAQAHLARASAVSEESLRQIRRVLSDLRPSGLEREPLHIALEKFATQAADGSSTKTEVIVKGSPRVLSADVENDLLRIAQEAITNALRHANAHRVEVELAYDADRVALRVRDDGIGAGDDHEEASSQRFGIRGMRERAARMKAEFRITSKVREGTEVAVQLDA